MTTEDLKAIARARIEAERERLLALSHRIHAAPELAYAEERSSGWVADALAGAGFAVDRGICDLPTAFSARSGPGPLRVAICAEYDALPEVGHACGHNIIAAAAVGAGIGLAAVADQIGVEALVLGTPAEEGGGGKIFMLERGAFDGVHAAMMVHPAPYEVADWPIIAASHFTVRYHGREAHASAFPQQGLNAADAFVVAQTAIGLLRQHLRETDRVHGIVTRGGDAANIIPAETTGQWIVRARTIEDLEDVRARVLRCFEAGALATGCELEIERAPFTYAEVRHDPDLVAAYRRNGQVLGRRFWPESGGPAPTSGSTDMGNISLAIPSIHPGISIDSHPAGNHQHAFAAAAIEAAADRAVIDGAIAMAWTAIDAATDPAVRERLLAGAR